MNAVPTRTCPKCDGVGSWPIGTRQCCPECHAKGVIPDARKIRLGDVLGIARECKGLTLRELEKQTGISNALLSQMENGHVREPSFRNVVKVAKALGLKLDRLAECE